MDAVEFAKLSRLQRLAEELAPTDHDLLKSMRNLEDNDAWCRFYWPPALRDLSASLY